MLSSGDLVENVAPFLTEVSVTFESSMGSGYVGLLVVSYPKLDHPLVSLVMKAYHEYM